MTWVLFDYGGVVSHPPADEDLALLAEVADVPVAALMDVYWAWRRSYDLAELDAPGYWREVGRVLGRDYGGAELAELIRLDQAAWLRLQPGTVALIEDLAAAGQPLAMLSNAPDELAEAIIELPVAAHFGHLIFSCQLNTPSRTRNATPARWPGSGPAPTRSSSSTTAARTWPRPRPWGCRRCISPAQPRRGPRWTSAWPAAASRAAGTGLRAVTGAVMRPDAGLMRVHAGVG